MFRFDAKKVVIGTKLGKGGYGTVYPYVDPKNPTDDRWAVKRILAPDFETVLAHINEIVLGFSCDHPAILPIKGYYIKRQDANYENFQIYIKMPRMQGTLKDELETHIQAKKHIPEEKIIQYLHTLVSGLEYLQKRKIAHRDIKPGNILLDKQGQVKLGDIGIGKLLGEDETTHAISYAGTLGYAAPELIDNNPQLKKKDLYKADVWSLGITMAELCLLHPKLGDALQASQRETALHEKLRNLQGKYSIELLELIMGLLQSDPAHRLTAAQVKEILEVEPWGINKYEFQSTHGNSSVNMGFFEERKTDEIRSTTANMGTVTDWRTGLNLKVNEIENAIEIIGKPRWVEENVVKSMLNDLAEQLKQRSLTIIKKLEANFSGCYSITDYSVKNLVKINESDFQNLQHIHLNFDYCFRVSDSALKEVATQVLARENNLQSVDLSYSYCLQISDQGVGALIDQVETNLRNLRSLRLAFRADNSITNETIRKISGQTAKGLRNLIKLDLDFKDCKQISFQEVDELVTQIALHLKQLQEINIVFSPFSQVPLKEKTDLQKQLRHIPVNKLEI